MLSDGRSIYASGEGETLLLLRCGSDLMAVQEQAILKIAACDERFAERGSGR